MAMPDVADTYADGMGLNLGPFGCAINFTLSPSTPQPGALMGQTVATIRMSLEHLKLMTFLLRRQLIEYERGSGAKIQIPQDVLNQMRIGREDWEECWETSR
jgi:hypothetical protein